jgi:dihydroxy-acid dehydratase
VEAPEQRLFAGALWKYAQLVGPAVDGALTHPGAKKESHVFADI